MTQIFSKYIGNALLKISGIIMPCCIAFCFVHFLQLNAFSQTEGNAYVLSLPPGVLEPIIPEDNPLTQGKVDLGKKLFFDKRLSVDDTVSCATCHNPEKGFAAGKVIAVGT